MALTGGLFKETEKIYSKTAGGEGLSGGALVNAKGEAVGIVTSTLHGPVYALGSTSTRELQELCHENGIPYTHHISTRLVRDAIAGIVFLAFIFLIACDEGVKKKSE